jgi:4-hydroxy-3-polyprenylbenzoate decarboxylase
VIGPNRVIMRWLAHRGGALDFRDHRSRIRASRSRSRSRWAPIRRRSWRGDAGARYARRISVRGLLRGARTELVKCRGSDLQVPASAEIVLEGAIHADDDGAGRAVRRSHRVLQRGREIPGVDDRPDHDAPLADLPLDVHRQAADEPAILGVALNEVFVPMLAKQFPEIADFYLPPEGCSYRMAVVAMKKQYPGTRSA